METVQLFRHCPRCAAPSDPGANPFRCGACGLTYYFNAAAAVAALITRDYGDVLLIRRAKDPARGKLALPGGFVDIGELVFQRLGEDVVALMIGDIDRRDHQLAAFLGQLEDADPAAMQMAV